MKHLIYMFFVLLIAGQTSAQETLTLTTDHWPPYQYEENGRIRGIAADTIQQAAQQLGYVSEIQLFPWKRALKHAETGESDGVLSALFTEERAQYLYYPSEPLFEVRTMFFALKDRPRIQVKGLADLKGLRIGVVSGYSYGAEFDNFPDLQKYACKDDAVLVQNLDKGRLDVAVSHELAFQAASRALGLQDRFTEVYILSQHPMYAAFSKTLGEKGQRLAAQFDRVLREMKANGQIQAIINAYLGAEQ